MKVLVVSNMYPSAAHSSFGVFVERITRQMTENGLQVRLAVRTDEGSKLGSYISFYWRAFFAAISGEEDLIYLHFVTHSWPPIALARLLRRKPLAIHVHGADIVPDGPHRPLRNWLLGKIAGHALERADVIIAPSDYFRDEVCKRFPQARGKTELSPSGGVDIESFSALPLPSGHRRILFLGRLIAGKGVLQILPALLAVQTRAPSQPFEMVFAGDGSLRQQLQIEAGKFSDAARITFIGEVSPAQVPGVIASCHFLVFPSFRKGESLGLAALEAMACGRPVIAARSGAMPECVSDGESGLLFEPGDVEAFSVAIQKLLECDDRVLSELGFRARLQASEYDSKRTGEHLVALLQRRFVPKMH